MSFDYCCEKLAHLSLFAGDESRCFHYNMMKSPDRSGLSQQISQRQASATQSHRLKRRQQQQQKRKRINRSIPTRIAISSISISFMSKLKSIASPGRRRRRLKWFLVEVDRSVSFSMVDNGGLCAAARLNRCNNASTEKVMICCSVGMVLVLMSMHERNDELPSPNLLYFTCDILKSNFVS